MSFWNLAFLGQKKQGRVLFLVADEERGMFVNQQLPRKIDKHHRCLEDHGEEGSQVESHKNI